MPGEQAAAARRRSQPARHRDLGRTVLPPSPGPGLPAGTTGSRPPQRCAPADGPKEPLGPLPAGVIHAGGPAGQVGAAPLEAAAAARAAVAAGLDFLRIAARLKGAPSAPLILGAGERDAE